MEATTVDRGQAIQELSERKLTEKQLRFATFLADYIESHPDWGSVEGRVVQVLDATREFNAIERARKETGQTQKPPKLRVITEKLAELIEHPESQDPAYVEGVEDAKQVVERYA